MNRTSLSSAHPDHQERLTPVARFPGLRALAWSGDVLYASRRYELLRADIHNPAAISWQRVAAFRPALRRRLSAITRLTARLFRDGFHALAAHPSGALVAAVPGAIITLRSGETDFRKTHAILRGTRPLHITAVPSGALFWGEYFDNPARDPVHIYASTDAGTTWSVAHTFPRGAIRHVHNIVHDPWDDCLWILTGDYGDECCIFRATCDLTHVESVLQGQQQTRAVGAIPTPNGLYFASDTPLESNYIYRLDRRGALQQLAPITSSCIYGCSVGTQVFFSTMVEPSQVNRDRQVRIYAGRTVGDAEWNAVLSWQKDIWPMGLFQYGNALMPDGPNTTPFLVLTTVAVQHDDMATMIYSVNP